ncbi:MAG: pseudouridine-5'-phosphate glycosidase, partial [Phaeodactylibacter sp.]|nr:pseudouridine-5'-phosphate glycosidase [Phaeodactylibacter sp.]
LEYLETYGVPVLGYQTEEFPAFYSRSSGLPVDCRVDDPSEIARMMKAKWELGLAGGLLIANPIPEAYAMPAGRIDTAIRSSIREAAEMGVKGKALTPFLLSKVEELTEGRSLQANIQLVLNNAAVAASLAVEYAKLGQKTGPVNGQL